MYIVNYTEPSKKDLRKLDRHIAQKIIAKIAFYSNQRNIFTFAKPLENFIPEIKCYRFRIGDYRAIFTVEADGTIVVLVILRIKHRKDVYLRG